MSIVVCRVDAPAIAGSMMSYVLNAVSYRVEFAFFKRDFHSKSSGTFVEHAIFHVLDLL